MADWILEYLAWIKRLVSILIYPLAEDQLAEDRIGIGRDNALNLVLDFNW